MPRRTLVCHAAPPSVGSPRRYRVIQLLRASGRRKMSARSITLKHVFDMVEAVPRVSAGHVVRVLRPPRPAFPNRLGPRSGLTGRAGPLTRRMRHVAARRRGLGVELVVPSAARTVSSMRDIGYELPQAVADLVDNSISAGANRVDIDLHFDGESSWIRIADNGSGMDTQTLVEAMRYGSEREYAADDLGKFGFGLKTASTSQCRQVSVATRRSPERARLEARCLDLDHIESTNRWEILVLGPGERPDVLVEPLHNGPGTVVLWEALDRVLDYQDPWGQWARRRLLSAAEEIDQHLSMVYHRFLAGRIRGRRLTIRINRTAISPWDPFCPDEATQVIEPRDFQVNTPVGAGIVRVAPAVLPHQSEFSSSQAWQRASGPLKWNRQQGLYIYRANRLIQWGGWSRLRTADEHTKLARVALDFHPRLDAAFSINIAKAIVKLPSELRTDLEPFVSEVTRLADQRYRRGQSHRGAPQAASATRNPAPPTRMAPTGGGIHANAPTSAFPGLEGRTNGQSTAQRMSTRTALEEAARDVGETKALKKITDQLEDRHPEIARDLGW